MVTQVEYSVAGRSRGQVAPCVVCTGHVETRSVGFLAEPQNQGGGGFPGLGLKIGSFSLVIWASKSPRRFFGLGFKTRWSSVCRLRHKNRRREVGAGHTSRSTNLLGVEASLARVSQSSLKTGGDATTGGACGTITEVTSETS
jgi:hypothetical protein